MSSSKPTRAILSAILLVFVGLSFWVGAQWTRTMHRVTESAAEEVRGDAALEATPPPVVIPVPTASTAGDQSTIDVFRRASRSTVFVTSVAVHPDYLSRDLMGMPLGSGSGFVWDTLGHVVTNYHVIEGANAATVTLADHSMWDAELVGMAPEKDLAVLRIGAPAVRLTPLPRSSSSEVQIGQKVLAIGNPFGLDQTLTAGIISALGREIASPNGMPIRGVMQTDAAINPGNSGGPLLDGEGRLIGVNTAIYSPSGASAGVGFAIPVDTVTRVVPELIAYGRVRWPTIGVGLATQGLNSQLGIRGALILNVEPSGSAAAAGLRPTITGSSGEVRLGDVIVEANGVAILSPADLFGLVERLTPEETLMVTYVRAGQRHETEIVPRFVARGRER